MILNTYCIHCQSVLLLFFFDVATDRDHAVASAIETEFRKIRGHWPLWPYACKIQVIILIFNIVPTVDLITRRSANQTAPAGATAINRARTILCWDPKTATQALVVWLRVREILLPMNTQVFCQALVMPPAAPKAVY